MRFKKPTIVITTTLIVFTMIFLFSINRGLFVGTQVYRDGQCWYRRCDYLYPSGIRPVKKGGWDTKEQAASVEYCRVWAE
jgi:hypothetical protein